MGCQGNSKHSEWPPPACQSAMLPLQAPFFSTLARAQQQDALCFTPVFVVFLHLRGRRRFASTHFENNTIENINELIMHAVKKYIFISMYVLAIL